MAGKRFPEEFNHRDNIKKEDILLVNNSETDIDEYATIEEAFTLLDDKFNTKADKVSGATDDNFASLDENGNLEDSGKKALDFVEVVNIANNVTTEDEGKVLDARQGKVLNDAKINKNGTNSNIDVLHFDPDTVVALANVGDVRYSPESKTLEVKISNSCTIQIGQEMTARVKNGETSDILNGKVVYIDTALGSNPVAKLATTADQDIAQRTFAVATEDIATFGIVTTEGLVRDVNTDGMAEGSLIWLGTDGNFTTTEPTAPTPKVCIGMILRESATEGVIYVHIRAIPRMAKLSDVFTTTLTGGDILRYNSTSGRFEQFNITTALEDKQDAITITADTSPVNTDEVLSLRGSSWLKTTWTNIKAFLKTYFDSLYVLITDLTTIQPAVQFYKRVVADGGTIVDKSLLAKFYTEFNQSLANTHALYIPHLGMKTRTSGINMFGSKVYDFSPNNNDAVQATEATQPYVGGYIAPNEFRCLKYLQGQTQTGEVTIPTKSYLATDSWTLSIMVKINKKGTTGTSFQLGASTYIFFDNTNIILTIGGSQKIYGATNLEAGKISHIEFQYSNGAGLIKVNNIPINTTVISTTATFSYIRTPLAYPFDGSIYYFHLENVRISENDSQKRYTFLRSLLPEIEGVNIGNQNWITSNVEQTVAGNGEVIPEVQESTTANIVSNGGFVGNSNGWVLAGTTQWQQGSGDGEIKFTGSAANNILYQDYATGTIPANRAVRIRYRVVSNTITGAALRTGSISSDEAFASANTLPATVGEQSTVLITSRVGKRFVLFCPANASGEIVIDDVYFDILGWADLTTPAWCYYNNDIALGAVYGKLYNWYAIDLINKYAPQGWRVPSSADFTQLATALGGTTVAGGKMKKEGLTYWNSPNTGATNESGFSSIAGGRRNNNGNFAGVGTLGHLGNINKVYITTSNTDTNLTITIPLAEQYGFPLRYLRTRPTVPERGVIRASSTANIASTPLSIPIPFGCQVESIRIRNKQASTNLTSISATHNNTGGTSLGTLITGKTVNAGVSNIFVATQLDMASQETDGTIRILATGNGNEGMDVEVNYKVMAL